MRELFIPETKNPPAKVKDPGMIGLVMEGAGVFNAKTGELILLPIGRSNMNDLAEDLVDAFIEINGAQPVDCLPSESSLYSLSERFVREYREKALSWITVSDRKIKLWGWSSSEEDAEMKMALAADTARSVIERFVPDFGYLLEVGPGTLNKMVGVSSTEKGALYESEGYYCSECNSYYHSDSAYTAASEPVAAEEEMEEVKDVHTPGAHTIPLLCDQLGVDPSRTLKAMLYTVTTPEDKNILLFAMIRGDKNININKLAAYVDSKFKGATLRRAENNEIESSFGDVAGFCGPIGVPDDVHMISDKSLECGRNFVVGGNRPDYHRTGCCWGRDFAPEVADLLLFEDTTPCPEDKSGLEERALRKICEMECYLSEERGEAVLSCRDRSGEHRWPYRWKGEISLEPLLLSMYEKKEDRIRGAIFNKD